MGDSETAVTEPPAVMNCTAAGYTSNGYADAISNIVPVPGVYIAEGARNFTASFVAAQAAYTGNAYGTDLTYIVLDGHVEAAYGTEAVVGTGSTINNAAVAENASFVSPQAAGYDSAVDGNTSTKAGVVLSDENGNAGEAVGGADAVQQFLDGSVPEMSAEEDRLWSIVKANSLDFDAWIALLDETEKVAGVSSCLPNHLLSGKEGPSFRVCGAFLLPNGVFLMHISFMLCIFPFINKVMDSIVHVFLSQVVNLYERCIIACANYTEYWIRYVLCMEAYGNMDLANNALARATQVFVKRQPVIHLFAARFKEQNGDIPGARAAYRVVHAEIAPGLLEAITKHANMERRLGNLEDAFSLYEQAIGIEKGKELPLVLPALYAQYAQFIYLTSKNLLKARKVLFEALEHAQFSKLLLEALIHLETFLPQPKQIDYLDSLVDNFILTSSDSVNTASATEREELSCIFLEFLGIFGDAQSIKKAADRHAKFFLPHSSKSELKKRHAEDYLSSDRAKIAKPYSDATSPPQSLMGAYTSEQNQWTAGYGLQPQAWPPATQVQTQQWTPGFNQQVAYGGYGGSYTSPQVPTSVAQGAYPPTCPAQAFPQQSYAQPAAALTPAQQPAFPQPYYGSYY